MNEMNVIGTECKNCGKKIYVEEGHVRDEMFCTLGCMEAFNRLSRDAISEI